MKFKFGAKYLFRLDDACPTMHSGNWTHLERLFDEFGIAPIVGVIPDNRDPGMMNSTTDSEFWGRMRHWQSKGWEIVMHGLHHVYHPIGEQQLPFLPVSDKSEFVGLSLESQIEMLEKGYRIMSDEGVIPRAFMAPSHTFDENTLHALREVTDIRIITDGHAFVPFKYLGFTWVPQQIWRFRRMPFGYWCICLHPNTMTINDIDDVRNCLLQHSKRFVDFDTFLAAARPKSVVDSFFESFYRVLWSTRHWTR